MSIIPIEHTPAPSELPRNGGVYAWRAIQGWSSKAWEALHPGPEARRGAIGGALIAVAVVAAVKILYQGSGFGSAVDGVFAISAAIAIISMTAVLVMLVLAIARRLPLLTSGMIVGSCVAITFIWFPRVTVRMTIVSVAFALAAALAGATVATFASSRFRHAAMSTRILTGVLFTVAAVLMTGFVSLLAGDGDLDNVSSWRPPVELMPPVSLAANPADRGAYIVKTLLYGAGSDLRRPEYGPSLSLRTGTVDASAFFRRFTGWKRSLRNMYWGFDLDALPLNGRVWYPDGAGPFPLVVIVHGNHRMVNFSDPGYEYLGELLASRGFILASIDQNFLNAALGTYPELPSEQAVRGWLLLEHLRRWHEWNGTPGNPFHGKMDVNRIALIGHSRGGEAAATAAAFNRMKYYPDDASIRFNYGFGIQAVIAIAPPDGQYKPAGRDRWIENVNYLTLQGGHDADVSTFGGSRQWERVRYTRPGSWFRAEIWAYGANHGQFNTEWGRADFVQPFSWFLNLKPLMTGEDQRRISKTYIAAFLEAVLNDRREYVSLFKDWRTGRQWLPETIYINRYRDASYTPVAGFQDDADITTATTSGGSIEGDHLTVWREGPIPTRGVARAENGVFLGWNRGAGSSVPVYSISLPSGAASQWQLSDRSTLELSIAAMDENAPPEAGAKKGSAPPRTNANREPPDFSIELVTSDGVTATMPVTRFAAVPPPLKEKFTKIDFVEPDRYARDWEPVFQTVRVPLAAFVAAGGKMFDPGKLTGVRFRFDRTPTNVICISAVGFGTQ